MTTLDQRRLANELLNIARRDRARRSRWRAFGKFLGGLLKAIVTSALASLLGGWFLMLAVGVAHDHWISRLPTLGYWWAVLIYGLLPALGGSRSSKDGER